MREIEWSKKLSLDNLPHSFGFTGVRLERFFLSLCVCVRVLSINKISNAIHEYQM